MAAVLPWRGGSAWCVWWNLASCLCSSPPPQSPQSSSSLCPSKYSPVEQKKTSIFTTCTFNVCHYKYVILYVPRLLHCCLKAWRQYKLSSGKSSTRSPPWCLPVGSAPLWRHGSPSIPVWETNTSSPNTEDETFRYLVQQERRWQEAVCHSLTSAGIFGSLHRNGFINRLNVTVMCEALMYWVESSSSSSEESSSSSSSSGSLSWLRPSSSFRSTRLKSSAGLIWKRWNWADVILHASTRVHAKQTHRGWPTKNDSSSCFLRSLLCWASSSF